jgi:hypothetical protein
MKLKIDIHSYWHAGTGKGEGAVLDAVVLRDTDGLPYLPGKTVKGLLRDAVYRACQWNRVQPKNLDEMLFGMRTFDENSYVKRSDTRPGKLMVGDAQMEDELRKWLRNPKEHDAELLKKGLFFPIYSTAIEADTGTAKNQSLRGIEVTMPLTLYAELDVLADAPDDWQTELKKALPLIRAVGAGRSRGLGRATVSLED